MNQIQCANNISLCLSLYNLTLCPFENNTCVENHGYCVFSESIRPTCQCLPCYTGKHCEEDKVSQNLWYVFMPIDKITLNGTSVRIIIYMLFGIFLLLNGIPCLQTYLCRKIRKTNLGIYLIMLSIVSILIGLIQVIFSSIILHLKELSKSQQLLFVDLYCPLYSKFITTPLVSMYNWFIASVAIERVLIECFDSFTLHDSRRRSIVVSIIIVIVCTLTTLPGVFTVRQNQPPELLSVQCINFTPLGYTLYVTITRIHILAFYLIYIVMNIIVLVHLLRHRRRFVDDDKLPSQVCLILRKHKDFFIPYLIQTLGQLPMTVIDFTLTCSMAATIVMARLTLAFIILQVLPFAVTFYLYIYLSPVYWSVFWDLSPIGKGLTKIKTKLRTIRSNKTIEDTQLLDTRF